MLFTNPVRSRTYIAAAGQTDFVADFPYGRADDLAVTRNGVSVPFSALNEVLDGSLRLFGTLRLASPAAMGDTIIIFRRTLPQQRSVQLPRGAFSSAALNDEVTRLWMKASDLDAENLQRYTEIAAIYAALGQGPDYSIITALVQQATSAATQAGVSAQDALNAAGAVSLLAPPAIAAGSAVLPALAYVQGIAGLMLDALVPITTTAEALLAGPANLGNLIPIAAPFSLERLDAVRADLSRSNGTTINLGDLI